MAVTNVKGRQLDIVDVANELTGVPGALAVLTADLATFAQGALADSALQSGDIGVSVQAFDATIVVDADIGSTVQAFDATILVDADIGVNVQAFDATIVVDADIGSTVQGYDATILNAADIGVSVQAYSAVLAATTGTFLVADQTTLDNALANTTDTFTGVLTLTGTLDVSGGVDKLRSATTAVDVSAAAAPTVGQILTAVNGTLATWQNAPTPIDAYLKLESDAAAGNAGAKINKVAAATTGNFAEHDATGQLQAGSSAVADFATAAQGGLADSALQSVAVSDLDNGTDGELITWDATGVAATVPVGTATHVLTSNGIGAAPTFQVIPAPAAPTSLTDADGDTKIQVEEGADDDTIRFDTGAGITGYPANPNALVVDSSQFAVSFAQATGSPETGGAISLLSGQGNGSGSGGTIDIVGGQGGTTGAGGGGRINVTGGLGGGASGGTGGPIFITGGASTDATNQGGGVIIKGGIGGSQGGGVTLTAADGGSLDNSGSGGAMQLTAGGGGSTSGNGGAMIFTAGDSPGGQPGDITFNGATIAGTNIKGSEFVVNAGDGTGTNDGGDVALNGGEGGATGDGGDIILTPGGNTAGVDGVVSVVGQLAVTGPVVHTIATLAATATPSVAAGRTFLTGGTTTITDFTGGFVGQEIIILSEHAITITDGTNMFLSGSVNFVMASTDSLHLIQKADGNWYEIGRSVN